MIQGRSPQFRWLERGDGEPVVLLHGLMGYMDHWDTTLDAMAPWARLIAPELPFFDTAFEDLSLAALARHVRLIHPERVSGLVLTGSSGLFERSFAHGVPHRPTVAYVREKMEEVFYDPALVTDGWVRSVHRTVTTRISARRVVRLARAARTTNVAPFLSRIQTPALLVWGQDDRITPPSVAQRFQALIPRSELVVLLSCGHVPMLEQPAAFNSVVRHWLETTRALREGRTAAAVAPMITRTVASALEWYAPRRRRALEDAAARAGEIQERTLRRLVAAAASTQFGRAHDFRGIRSIADYEARVGVGDYLAFKPREAFASHRRGVWDALVMAVERVGAAHLLGGPMLYLGGCTRLAAFENDALVGDLSRLAIRRLPPGLRRRYSPGPALSAITDWETRIDAIAQLTARQDLRLVSGMPSWTLILFERVAAHLRATGHAPVWLGQIWPNLAAVIHGGVSFGPYRGLFEQAMGRSLEYVEVYPAAEVFVGVQTERSGGLTLMVDYGIFYEFIPVEDLGSSSPCRHTVDDVVLGEQYAVAVTTPAGLWSYLLGDTVRFIGRDPLRLEITGRTRHFVNAFGENVILEEVERAVLEACRRGHAEIVEFTVAPRYPSAGEARGGHEWLIEFAEPPRAPETFARTLDDALRHLNMDYRTKRTGDVGMVAPRVLELPAGTFYRWMRERGMLGGQHKVPRVTNDRTVADGVLDVVHAQYREPLISVGS